MKRNKEKTLEMWRREIDGYFSGCEGPRLDKNGNVYMDYNVAELKAAREMYGLAPDELLVVGGMDDPVMKIGADGKMKPVEE